MPDRIRGLLDAIVTQYAVVDEQKDIDLNAPATESGGEIETEKEEAVVRERERADALAEPFRLGLQAAWQAHRAGRGELPLDDRRPDENAMADAMIAFLVSFDLAESRTEETEPLHYIYHVRVDWDRLGGIARTIGLDLDEALRQTSR